MYTAVNGGNKDAQFQCSVPTWCVCHSPSDRNWNRNVVTLWIKPSYCLQLHSFSCIIGYMCAIGQYFTVRGSPLFLLAGMDKCKMPVSIFDMLNLAEQWNGCLPFVALLWKRLVVLYSVVATATAASPVFWFLWIPCESLWCSADDR